MEYIAAQLGDMLANVPWKSEQFLRIFWVRYSTGSRDLFSQQVPKLCGAEGIVAIPVRDAGFQNANAILSDVQRLFIDNKDAIENLNSEKIERLSIILIGKNDFQLPQGSSHITLPNWFPVEPGRETYFEIADLGLTAETALMNCQEARLEQIAEFTYGLMNAIVVKVSALEAANCSKFVNTAHKSTVADVSATVSEYRNELILCTDPRAYRPNAAKDSKALVSRLLRLVVNASSKDLPVIAKDLADCFANADHTRLKPTLFAVMFRPPSSMTSGVANWHSVLLGLYQAYQIMNSAAHADEYPHYSIALQFASSVDLRTFLVEARSYVEVLK